MKWLDREEWSEPFKECLVEHLADPCEDAGVAVEELQGLLADEDMSTLWGCIFEDFVSTELEDGRNIIDNYLERRGWKEGVANKRYLTALRSSVMSLYEVSDVVRDRSFLARDLLRGGEPVLISEKAATHSLKQWDCIGARVLRIGARNETGGGVLLFDREIIDDLRDGFETTRKEMHAAILERAEEGGDDAPLDSSGLDAELLRRAASLFTYFWLADRLGRLVDPEAPTLVNSEGDLVVFTTVRYPLKPGVDRAAVEEALTAVPDLHSTDEDLWNWVAAAPATKPEIPADASVFATTFEDGSISMGQVELQAEAIVLEANSSQRARKGQALLEPLIAPFVEEPILSSRTMEEVMESEPESDAPPAPSPLPPDEESRLIREMFDRHYREVLDQPVKMLGNVSPRRAVETREGRENVVEWLKYMENLSARQEARSGTLIYDFGWMWEELGIADRRR